MDVRKFNARANQYTSRWTPIKEVLGMFKYSGRMKEGGKGIRGGKKTLIFRPNNWSLMPAKKEITEYEGNYFVIETGEIGKGKITPPKGGKLFPNKSLGIILQNVGTPITYERLKTICGIDEKHIDELKSVLDVFPPSAEETIKDELKLLDMRKSGKKKVSNQLKPFVVNLVWHDHLRLNGMDEQLKSLAPQMIFIIDEFHKTLNKSIRTSLALEVARLSNYFIAMTGTLIKDLVEWLGMVVNFEVNKDNYPIAISSIISRKVETKVAVEADFDEEEKKTYYNAIPEKMGGNAYNKDFKTAVDVSYFASYVLSYRR